MSDSTAVREYGTPKINPQAERGEIINPSDHYTIEIDDRESAYLAVNVLSGMLFLQDETGASIDYPESHFADLVMTPELAARIAKALRSIVIGDAYKYAAKSAGLEGEALAAFFVAWDDKYRSSLNQIGAAAMHYAARYEEIAATLPTPAPADGGEV